MTVTITTDNNNLLLERREITCTFKNTPNLKKQNAIQLVKEKLKSENELIIPIKLKNNTGLLTVEGMFYVYSDKNKAESQINKHILSRLTKNDK